MDGIDSLSRLKLEQICILKLLLLNKLITDEQINLFHFISHEREWNKFLWKALSYIWNCVEIGTISNTSHKYYDYVVNDLIYGQYDIHYIRMEANSLPEIIELKTKELDDLAEYINAITNDIHSDFTPVIEFNDSKLRIIGFSYHILGTYKLVLWSYWLVKFLKQLKEDIYVKCVE